MCSGILNLEVAIRDVILVNLLSCVCVGALKCECIMNAGHRMAQRAQYNETTGLHTLPTTTCPSPSESGWFSVFRCVFMNSSFRTMSVI